jgi:hypothetical protein
MPKNQTIPEKYQVWIDARKRYHLSHAQIQKARELGMNPKKFGQLANHKQESWKAPLPNFIETIYFKRFGKVHPDNIKSIEQIFKDHQEKKQAKRIKDVLIEKESTLRLTENNQSVTNSGVMKGE